MAKKIKIVERLTMDTIFPLIKNIPLPKIEGKYMVIRMGTYHDYATIDTPPRDFLSIFHDEMGRIDLDDDETGVDITIYDKRANGAGEVIAKRLILNGITTTLVKIRELKRRAK